MVERKGPGYKCACKNARVALMDDLLGKVKVDLAMLDPQEILLWVDGNFALLKDEVLKIKGYPPMDSDVEKKEREKEKEKKKMEEEHLNEEKLRKKKEKNDKVKARLILSRREKGKEEEDH